MKKILFVTLFLVLSSFVRIDGVAAYCECGGGLSTGPGGYSLGVTPFYPSMPLEDFFRQSILQFLLETYKNKP